MLDINLFRTGRTGKKKEDGDPDAVRESQRKRFASVEIVDELLHQVAQERLAANGAKYRWPPLMSCAWVCHDGCFVHVQRNNELKVKELMESTNGKERLAATEAEVRRIKIMLHTKLMAIGNIVHESVPIGDNEVR
ncbi:serine--tRNA ligase, cytoplasmic-like [Miscanthus floridulus]|uniref:serine--tRNA ligase, cytoplasmic-like n=1 Tax=Miscanthus floridulus TaxID=154761 RepID=UPI003458B88E